MTHRWLNIIITAGPTCEPIDPVRFVCNRSTGTMGFSVAAVAKRRGHKVVLISGPTQLKPPQGIRFFSVKTARQMLGEVLKNFPAAGAVIMAAAVADYRPAKPSPSKIKKTKTTLNLRLLRNPDILGALAKKKKDKILVGLCLETENLYKNALKKLKEKKLDIIVANLLTKKQDVFGQGRTSVLIIDKNGNKKRLENVSKNKVAQEIIKRVEEIKAKNSAR